MKNFTIPLLAATTLGLTACGGPSDSGEVTVEDVPNAEVTRTEVKTDTVLSAEPASTSVKEQGEKLVGEAETKALKLREVDNTINADLAINAEKLKTESTINSESAKAMAETRKKMVEEVKEAKPE